MIKEIRLDNELRVYDDDKEILNIKNLGDGYFIVENINNILKGYFKVLDNGTPELKLDYDFNKYKNRRLRKNQKLFDSDRNWFKYILEKHGFIKKYNSWAVVKQ